jgi:hypothetical protein
MRHLRAAPAPLALGATLAAVGAPLPAGSSDFTLPNEGEPLQVFMSTGDVWQNTAESGFNTSPGAMRQGPVRLARAQNFFLTCRRMAAERGWAFRWRYVEVSWIGHDAKLMFAAKEMERALFGAGGAKP